MDKDAARLIQKVRDRVERTDWTKGSYMDPDGKKPTYCLVGLLNDTTHSDPMSLRGQGLLTSTNTSRGRAAVAIYKAIKKLYPTTQARQIEDWNDRSRTTRKDVLEVLDEALKQ